MVGEGEGSKGGDRRRPTNLRERGEGTSGDGVGEGERGSVGGGVAWPTNFNNKSGELISKEYWW